MRTPQDTNAASASRRAFFGRAATSVAAGGVAVTAIAASSEQRAIERDAGPADSAAASGYRETAHISRYYRLARI